MSENNKPFDELSPESDEDPWSYDEESKNEKPSLIPNVPSPPSKRKWILIFGVIIGLVVIMAVVVVILVPIVVAIYGKSQNHSASSIVMQNVQLSEVTLNVATAGSGDDIIMLHGFPEGWSAFVELFPYLTENYHLVVPDQRGYNLSQKPVTLDDYHIQRLVIDVNDLLDKFTRNTILVGHDWGGVVAFIAAHYFKEKVRGLIVINAPHPNVFETLLKTNVAQQNASSYIMTLLRSDSEQLLSENNFERLLKTFEDQEWFDERKVDYLNAWNVSGALNASLNWYKRNFLGGPNVWNLTTTFPPNIKIEVPTLVLWGSNDKSLIFPDNVKLMKNFVENLWTKDFPNGTHWIMHEKPKEIAESIHEFIRLLQ